MPSTHQRTPNSRGPVRDAEARRICSLSGLVDAKERVATLRELQAALEVSLRELDAQRKRDSVVIKALVLARFTKATCDAFIAMAQALRTMHSVNGKELGPKDLGSLIQDVYGGATTLAEELSQGSTTRQVDLVKSATAISKIGVSAALYKSRQNGQDSSQQDGMKHAATFGFFIIELVHAALNGDEDQIVKSSTQYFIDLRAEIFDLAGWKKASALVQIANSAFEYHSQLTKAFEELIDNKSASEEQYTTLKTNLMIQGRRVARTIDELEKFIESCERQPEETAASRKHTVKQGESLSKIALLWYKDMQLWPLLFDANPHIGKDYNRILPGQVLMIPDLIQLNPAAVAEARQRHALWRRS